MYLKIKWPGLLPGHFLPTGMPAIRLPGSAKHQKHDRWQFSSCRPAAVSSPQFLCLLLLHGHRLPNRSDRYGQVARYQTIHCHDLHGSFLWTRMAFTASSNFLFRKRVCQAQVQWCHLHRTVPRHPEIAQNGTKSSRELKPLYQQGYTGNLNFDRHVKALANSFIIHEPLCEKHPAFVITGMLLFSLAAYLPPSR